MNKKAKRAYNKAMDYYEKGKINKALEICEDVLSEGLDNPAVLNFKGLLLYQKGNLTEAISLELPAEFAKIQALHVLEAVGFTSQQVSEILTKYPDELSEGEKHRVAIAQVLIKEPNIVMLDEPTGTMDPITRVIVTDSILKARDELKQTFIIVSHDMDFVLDVCDRAGLMRGGKLLDVGTPEEIVKKLTSSEKEDMLKNQ